MRYVGLYLQIAGAVEGGEGSLVVIQHINYTAEDHFYCGCWLTDRVLWLRRQLIDGFIGQLFAA